MNQHVSNTAGHNLAISHKGHSPASSFGLPAPDSVSRVIYDLMFRLVLQNKLNTDKRHIFHPKPFKTNSNAHYIRLVLVISLPFFQVIFFPVAKWQQLISLFRAQNSFVPKDMLTKDKL